MVCYQSIGWFSQVFRKTNATITWNRHPAIYCIYTRYMKYWRVYIYVYIYGTWFNTYTYWGLLKPWLTVFGYVCHLHLHTVCLCGYESIGWFLSFFTMELPKLSQEARLWLKKAVSIKQDSETSPCLPIEISIHPLEKMIVFYPSIGWLFESFTSRKWSRFPVSIHLLPINVFHVKWEFCLAPNMYGKKGVVFSHFHPTFSGG